MPTLLSVQVGLPQRRVMPAGVRVDLQHPHWTSGIFKEAVRGTVEVTQEGIGGDGQADLEFHGGPDNVVLAYDAELYPMWREVLGKPELPFGAFGENFTVEGLSDDEVCIGDTWQVGETLRLQVTQPRQPCYKLGRRLGTPEAVRLTIEKGWGGWYLRVLQEGFAEAGMAIELVERPHPEWPVQQAVWLMYDRKNQPERAGLLAQVPELSARWKQELLP